MIGLTDRTAIVTGAAKGIGEAIALALSSAGARVVIADVDEEAGAAVADRLGSDVAACARCDVSREEDVRSCVQLARKRFGALDIMINKRQGRHRL